MAVSKPSSVAADLDKGLVIRLKKASQRLSVVVMLVGAAVLLGWWQDILWLKSLVPGLAVMPPNAAIAFTLAGLALGWEGRMRGGRIQYRGVQMLAIACLTLGLLGLVSPLVSPYSRWGEAAWAHEVYGLLRLPPNTALNFSYFGLALLGTQQGCYRLTQGLGVVIFYVAFAGFLGYVYDVRLLYGLGAFVEMALPSSLTFMMLAIALLLRHADRGLMVALTANHAGGEMTRRVLLSLICVPVLLCGLTLQGYRWEWYSAELSVVLLCLLTVLLMSLLTWGYGSLLGETDYYASRDNLTGLFNRRYFERHLIAQMKRCRQRRQLLGVLLLNIDRFKRINDVLGHHLGDQLLVAIGDRLQSIVEPLGLLARWEGDEFTVLLPQVKSTGEATTVAQQVLNDLSLPFSLGRQQISITASLGIAIFPEDGEDYLGLMQKADLALYEAKCQGRNNYQVYSLTLSEAATESLKLENALLRALDLQEFSLCYQPQANVRTGRITGFEALLRWYSAELGWVSPGRFIPVAEESGLIHPIGEWVLRQVCLQGRQWHQRNMLQVPLAVNVSIKQFHHLGFLDLIERILTETCFPPTLLELEITETTAMQDMECVRAKLYQIQDLGVKLVLDDFGTGFSSLTYLRHFPLHCLKIDASFIRGTATDGTAQGIIRSIVDLGHNLNLQVLAEGVETREQLDFLRQVNCDTIQGYVFRRPMPVKRTAAFLQRMTVSNQFEL